MQIYNKHLSWLFFCHVLSILKWHINIKRLKCGNTFRKLIPSDWMLFLGFQHSEQYWCFFLLSLYLWIWYLAGTCPPSRYIICNDTDIPVSALKIFFTRLSSILSISGVLYIALAPYNTLFLIKELRKLNPNSNVYSPVARRLVIICFFPDCLFVLLMILFIFLPSWEISIPRYVNWFVFSMGFFPPNFSLSSPTSPWLVSQVSTISLGTWYVSIRFPTTIALHLSCPNCKYLSAVFTFMNINWWTPPAQHAFCHHLTSLSRSLGHAFADTNPSMPNMSSKSFTRYNAMLPLLLLLLLLVLLHAGAGKNHR